MLVNNAGVVQVGPIDHMTPGDFDEAMAVHFWAPLHATLAALPHMRTRWAPSKLTTLTDRAAAEHNQLPR